MVSSTFALVTLTLILPSLALAQTPSASASAPPPLPYGPAITLQQARAVSAAAMAEAAKNGWRAIVAVVDSSGQVVSLDRMDGAQFGSIDIARQKAWSAVAFKRPTKAFQDTLESGGIGLRVLTLDGVMPVDGGLPLVANGQIVGGIGISGVLPAHDGQIAKAGADALAAAATRGAP
jgi:glc operon protein GlcG